MEWGFSEEFCVVRSDGAYLNVKKEYSSGTYRSTGAQLTHKAEPIAIRSSLHCTYRLRQRHYSIVPDIHRRQGTSTTSESPTVILHPAKTFFSPARPALISASPWIVQAAIQAHSPLPHHHIRTNSAATLFLPPSISTRRNVHGVKDAVWIIELKRQLYIYGVLLSYLERKWAYDMNGDIPWRRVQVIIVVMIYNSKSSFNSLGNHTAGYWLSQPWLP